MLRKPQTIAFLAVTALAAIVLLGYGVRPPEPLYQHQPLSYWLDRLPGYHNGGWGGEWPRFVYADVEGDEDAVNRRLKETDRQTRAALAAIGTNGFEVILRRLKGHDSRARVLYWTWAVRLRLFNPDKIIPEEQRRGQAIEAFHRLGVAAKPAVPVLLALTRDSDPLVRSAAKFALGGIAPEERKTKEETRIMRSFHQERLKQKSEPVPQ